MTTKATEKNESAQLRARIEELEEELKSKEGKEESGSQKLASAVNDAAKRYSEESGKLLKGYTLAYLEGLRLASSSLARTVGEISDQYKPGEKETFADVIKNAPETVSAGYSKAIKDYAEIPGKVVDKFYESYSTTSEE